MNTTLYLLYIDDDTWSFAEDHLFSYLSGERKEKIMRCKLASSRKLSLYAVILSKVMLGKAMNVPFNTIEFGHNEHGKPYVLGHEDIHFNISHTKGAILLGISDRPIGVDIEPINNPRYNIMKRFYHLDEISYVEGAATDEEKSRRFFEVWTCKEAYAKGVGTGLAMELSTLNTRDLSGLSTSYINGFVCSVYTL